jgi:hypothetical protein
MYSLLFSPKDTVLRSDNFENILEQYEEVLGNTPPPALQKQIKTAIDESKNNGLTMEVSDAISTYWDESRDEMLVILKDCYNIFMHNATLYDVIVYMTGNHETGIKEASSAIDKYLAVVENHEKIALDDEKELLKETTLELKKTLSLIQEEEYSQEDLEAVFKALNEKYYSILESVLENIISRCR